MRISALLTLALVAGLAGTAAAQYTKAAGQNAPVDAVAHTTTDKDGRSHTEIVQLKPKADRFGNAQGNEHDLAIDGAFSGQTVAVIQLYTGEGFDFSLPRAALKEKGFSVFRWSNGVPSPDALEKGLAKASQLWIISGESQLLTDAHVKIIKKFFDAGHGVYIWGDNEPYYADANFVARALLGTTMLGNVMGDNVVGVEKKLGGPGILPNHLLTTGLENIYEGITIATIQPSTDLKPLIYGSAGNLVAAYYDHDGKRAILDGGFTRLYLKWDTAGTPRYVKNAGAWLANAERFGDKVVAITSDTAPLAPVGMKPVTSVPAMPVGPVAAPPVAPVAAPMETTQSHVSLLGIAAAALLAIVMLIVMTRLRARASRAPDQL